MSNESWPTRPLAELCESIDYGFTTSAKSAPPGPKFLRITDIVSGFIDWSAVPYCDLGDAPIGRYQLADRDIVVARTGATTGVSSIVQRPPEAVFASYLVRLRTGSDHDARYVAYAMKGPTYWDYVRGVLGDKSAQPNASASTLSRARIPVPPLPQQRAIAAVLGALDDKIEVNRKQARVLEGIARAVFRSWFVDFDPVRRNAAGEPTGLPDEIAAQFPSRLVDSPIGKVPDGWGVGTVGELLSLSRDAIDPGDFPSEEFDHFSIPAFDLGQMASIDRGETIKSQKFVVITDCVLVSKLNPRTPRVWLPPATGPRRQVASTEFLVCTGDEAKHVGREFIYCMASSAPLIEHLTSHASGTSNSHQRVRPQDFLGFPCVQPPTKLLGAFKSTAEPFFGRIAAARAQSTVLAELRDTLLPQLISGNLRIADAGQIIGGASV